MKKRKEKLGGAPSSKEEDEGEVVQLVGVDLWRRGGASMVGKKRKLLHGLELERERLGESEGVREDAGRRFPGEGGWE